MKLESQRGSAILIAMILVFVATLIGVGVVNFASRGSAGARAGAKEQALVACAETARELLYSKFHAIGLDPISIEALNVPLDGPPSSARTFAVGGHIDSVGVQVDQVKVIPNHPRGGRGAADAARDLTNIITPMSSQQGTPMQITVHCQDHGDGSPTSGRQLEIEFGVRFGL